jgi:hypothetical protein
VIDMGAVADHEFIDGCVLRHVDQRAITHQRGIERDHAFAIGRHHLSEMLCEQRIAGGQRLRHRADTHARRQIRHLGQFGYERPVDKDDALRIHVPDQATGILRRRLGGIVRGSRERSGFAHQRAQVGVLPLLDSAIRQPFRLEPAECCVAQR